MAPDAQAPRHAACPACGAALRPGSPWCTLCYADLRPPEQRPAPLTPTAAPPHASYGPAAGDPLTQPLLDFLAPPPSAVPPPRSAPPAPAAVTPSGDARWPCATCGERNPMEATHCVCGAPFLAAVGLASRPSVVLPLVGDLSRLSRGQRVVGAIGIALLLMLPVALLTVLLTKPAPDEAPRGPVQQQPSFEPAPSASTEPIPSVSPTSLLPTAPGFPTPPSPVPTP